MKKAIIFYHSKTGNTKKYAGEIENYLKNKNLELRKYSIQDFKEEMISDADYILLGCWTSGHIFFNQHPEKVWVNFAKRIPEMPQAKTAFFTTYKFRTGSMFRNMYKSIKDRLNMPTVELKSKNGVLTGNDKVALEALVADAISINSQN